MDIIVMFVHVMLLKCCLPFTKLERNYVYSFCIRWPTIRRRGDCGIWIYNYLCNQCISPLKLLVRISYIYYTDIVSSSDGLGLWCITPLSTIFELYRGCQIYWWRKPEYPDKTIIWIYNYLCNQCISPLKLLVRISLIARCTRYNIMW
jgi:hypothetical protein